MRIRTVKPEFWTDAKIVQLPFHVRLLFIGLWNLADDAGCLGFEPERIKMQIFPADLIDVRPMLDLLEQHGLVEVIINPDGEYIRMPNFLKHQRIDHPSKSKYRDGSRKLAIPQYVRRGVAIKYGCEPGGEKIVTCYYCGSEGKIHWWKKLDGTPSFWVSFSLELDHVQAEVNGGKQDIKNIVLACTTCNRTKGVTDFTAFLEASRGLAKNNAGSGSGSGSGSGREGKGKDASARIGDSAAQSLLHDAKSKAPDGRAATVLGIWCGLWNYTRKLPYHPLPKDKGLSKKLDEMYPDKARLKEKMLRYLEDVTIANRGWKYSFADFFEKQNSYGEIPRKADDEPRLNSDGEPI